RARAQELVAEIAVAVFDVDELKPRTVREARRANEIDNDPIELAVGCDTDTVRKPAIEDRVRICGQRLGAVLFVRTREASGVRELQPDEEVVACRGSKALAVRGDEEIAQARQRFLRRVDEQ